MRMRAVAVSMFSPMMRGNISSIMRSLPRFATLLANLQRKVRRSTAGEIGALSGGAGPPHRWQRRVMTALKMLSGALVPNG